MMMMIMMKIKMITTVQTFPKLKDSRPYLPNLRLDRYSLLQQNDESASETQ